MTVEKDKGKRIRADVCAFLATRGAEMPQIIAEETNIPKTDIYEAFERLFGKAIHKFKENEEEKVRQYLPSERADDIIRNWREKKGRPRVFFAVGETCK